MMKPTYSIAFAAVLVVAALAGAVIVSDEADAEGAYTVTFDGEDAETITISGEVYYIVPDEPDADEGKVFTGWVDEEENALKSETVYYVSIDNGAYYQLVKEETEGAESVEVVSDIEADAAYTSQFDYCEIKWVVDGIVIDSGTTENVQLGEAVSEFGPKDPSKEGFNFVGWAVDGEIVTEIVAGEIVLPEDYKFVGDTTFTAVFEAIQLTVTLMVGDEPYGTVTALYGSTIVAPALPAGYVAWAVDAEGTEAYDFSQPVTEDITLYAVAVAPEEPSDIYTVTFVVDGVTIATYTSAAVTLPDTPVKEGYEFVGWYIGNELIADPVAYTFTQNTEFTAGFRLIDQVYWTVTFMDGETVVGIIEDVADGTVIEAIEAPEGKFWDFDFSQAITEDTVIYAQPEEVVVTFMVGDSEIAILTQTLEYGGKVDTALLASYTFPAGYDGWDFDFSQAIYKDTVIYATEVVEVVEPAFYETTTGQVAIVIAVFVILALIYAVYSNMFGLRDKLFKGKSKTETKEEE